MIAVNTFGDPKQTRANYFQFLDKHYVWKCLRRDYDCLAGKKCHDRSRSHVKSNHGVALYAPKFGRKKTSDDKQLAFKRFLTNNSRLSTQNTTEEIDGVVVPTRHLNDSISELFLQYALETHGHVSESTFRGLITQFKIFGDAHQDTDMCGYCMLVLS